MIDHATVCTDLLQQYNVLLRDCGVVQDGVKRYLDGQPHTTGIESFGAMLKGATTAPTTCGWQSTGAATRRSSLAAPSARPLFGERLQSFGLVS